MSDPERYFAADAGAHGAGRGNWQRWEAEEPIEMLPGLRFHPVLGERLMVSFVRFEPHTEAPVHWHDEEQITFVVDGELEFEVAGEKRVLRRGDSVVIPPNVPHGARTGEGPCLEVDVFHPPRRGLLEAMGLVPPADESS